MEIPENTEIASSAGVSANDLRLTKAIAAPITQQIIILIMFAAALSEMLLTYPLSFLPQNPFAVPAITASKR